MYISVYTSICVDLLTDDDAVHDDDEGHGRVEPRV